MAYCFEGRGSNRMRDLQFRAFSMCYKRRGIALSVVFVLLLGLSKIFSPQTEIELAALTASFI